MKRSSFLTLFLILIVSGCSTNNSYRVTYNSEPIGASVICGGLHQGYAPVTLSYGLSEHNRQIKALRTVSCKATWSSGYTKAYSGYWDLSQFPNGVMQTLNRPVGEGYSDDVNFALKVQSLQYQEKQAKAAKDAASAVESYTNRNRYCSDGPLSSMLCN